MVFLKIKPPDYNAHLWQVYTSSRARGRCSWLHQYQRTNPFSKLLF